MYLKPDTEKRSGGSVLVWRNGAILAFSHSWLDNRMVGGPRGEPEHSKLRKQSPAEGV